MPAAQIQFSQTPTTTPAGQSAIGYVTGTQVNFTDAAGGGATSWAWTIVGYPGSLTSAPVINNASTQTANINAPTTDGVYVIKLVRTDPGAIVTTDVRFFAIGDADYGYVLPSAGMTGNMTNIAGSAIAQNAGWEGSAAAPTSTNIFMDALLRFLRGAVGRFFGPQATVNFSSASPTTVTIVDGVDKPYRILNLQAAGTGLYTSQIQSTGPVPQQGKGFRYKVNITAGSGGLNILNGVAGPVILALVAPPSGTTSYNVDVVFDGTNWFVARIGISDPLALPKVNTFHGVAGLQTTAQTVATRIGTMRIDPTKFPANGQFTFQVALDTTGPLATVQLYNLTDSALVAGSVLTTTSTTTVVLTSGALTLPATQKDYEVQLFMATGGVSDHVDCTFAKVLLTWG